MKNLDSVLIIEGMEDVLPSSGSFITDIEEEVKVFVFDKTNIFTLPNEDKEKTGEQVVMITDWET